MNTHVIISSDDIIPADLTMGNSQVHTPRVLSPRLLLKTPLEEKVEGRDLWLYHLMGFEERGRGIEEYAIEIFPMATHYYPGTMMTMSSTRSFMSHVETYN